MKEPIVPFVDLKAQMASIRPEIDAVISNVLDSCQFILGEHVANFEKAFAQYCQCSHAVAVNSGTSAIHLALLASGIGAGDEVITTPHTFVATVAAICYTGAKPIFVDIDPSTLNISAEQLSKVISSRTKAIMPVHLYGQPADMDPILKLAEKNNLIVIEDAAQAHGAEYHGKRVGSIGALGCFSFYPGKNLGACGEGGIITTNSDELADKIRLLRDWGATEKYQHTMKGFNYRMEAIQGAVLGIKLTYLDKWTGDRQSHAALYNKLLAGSGVKTPEILPDVRHVYHVYTIRTANRHILQRKLHENGIMTGIHYPIPVHLQEGYADLGYKQDDFPHTEQAATEVLSLPLYPELTPEQVERVAETILNSLEGKM